MEGQAEKTGKTAGEDRREIFTRETKLLRVRVRERVPTNPNSSAVQTHVYVIPELSGGHPDAGLRGISGDPAPEALTRIDSWPALSAIRGNAEVPSCNAGPLP